MAKDAKEKEPRHTPEQVRDISEKVYRMEFERDCHGNTKRMLEKDGDGGVKLRNRAAFYDALTRTYFKVLDIKP